MMGVIITTTIITITIFIIVIVVGEQLKVSGAHVRTVEICWDGFHVIQWLESDDCKPLTQP
jgi:hypothetical protein